LLSWALKRYSRAWRGDWFGARKNNLARLAIAGPDEERQREVGTAYERCIAAAAALDGARSQQDEESLGRIFENAVTRFDSLVFDLYGTTPDELRVIRSM